MSSNLNPNLVSECPEFVFVLSDFCQSIGRQLGVKASQVEQAVKLLNEGNTIPFIARYRKEMTSGMDETQLRAIEDGLTRQTELIDRKITVVKSIFEQGKLTAELVHQITVCSDRKTLEDLYLPFRPKKRTRATIARERGLQPLADLLLAQKKLNQPVASILQAYVSAAKRCA